MTMSRLRPRRPDVIADLQQRVAALEQVIALAGIAVTVAGPPKPHVVDLAATSRWVRRSPAA